MTRLWSRLLAVIVASGSWLSVATAQQTLYSHGDPTALEQQMLELVNRARMNPPQEGVILNAVNTAYSVAARASAPSFFTNLVGQFATYPAVQPLAFNSILIQAARAHSQDMITNHYFGHISPWGQDPTARAVALGYAGGVGENIYGAGASTEADIQEAHFDFMVDYNNIDTASPLGHRLNVLNSSYSEIGVGVVGPQNGGMTTQDFGNVSKTYILGVAYSDANGNGSYDVGEGLAGITVKPASGNWFAVTSTSGGYAIPVSPVQTTTGTVNVPFAVQGSAWASAQPYDTAYRQQQLAAAPNVSVNLTWSGGALAAPVTTTVTMKRPVLINYRIVGTDGYYYSMSMVTSQSVKADFTPASASISPASPGTSPRDFNGDGKADILLQDNSGNLIAWFMNGSLAAPGQIGWSWITNGLGAWSVVGVADMDGDGKPDILLQDNSGNVIVWYMNGNSTKPAQTSWKWIATGLGPWRVVAVADMNGDGKADILFQDNSGNLIVWYMNGSLTAPAQTSWKFISTGLGSWRVAGVADMDGDGRADILFQDNSGNLIVWYMNGSLAAPAQSSWKWISTGLGPWRVVGVADMDGDGKADILFQDNSGNLIVWYMNGSLAAPAQTSWKWIATGLGTWRVH